MEFYTLIEVPKESDRKEIAFGVMVPCLPGCFSAGDTMALPGSLLAQPAFQYQASSQSICRL